MEIINKRAQRFILVTFVLLIMGCQSSPTKKIVVTSAGAADSLAALQIDYTALKNVKVSMSSLGYSGDQLALSMSQASKQPGVSPGVNLVGALIAGNIIQASAQSAAQKQKNAPLDGFLLKLEKLNWDDAFESSKLASKYSIADPLNVEKPGKKLLLIPFVEVSADYRSLILSVEVSLRGKNNKILYNNFFHIQSESLLKNDEILGVLNDKTDHELRTMIDHLIALLPELIEGDMNGWPNKNLTNSESIQFTNSLGQYFERGYVLDVKQNTIVFKSLRGEVKSIPFIEML